MGHSSPPRFHKDWGGEKYSESEILGMLRSFDLVVMESPRPIVVETLQRLQKRGLPPIALVDNEDYDYIHDELIKKFDISLVFKRELSFPRSDVHPFPFSSYIIGDERYDFDDSKKELDVFFLAGNTYPSRVLVSKTLKKIVREHGYTGLIGLDREPNEPLVDHTFRFKNGGARLGLEGYLKCIAKSKIAVSVRGFGRDTIRMWEIPSYNTLLLSDNLYDMGLIHPHPFTDGENVIFFKPDCSDLEEKVVYLLENDDVRRKVAVVGHKYLCDYHTNKRRAEQFLGIVEKEVL